ncbi:hypothetical protein KDN34_02830 [Shewanella yunxiaonensis]|uniref:Uncharacterized protein n=1 Tax=Shewanella yunxiaonensis TaxID=2829809 RepID=A0ABX7YWG2_9GAMM|nr:ETEC_3214 domain-containing protein [Shewanella yunxiaonensis]QUN06416.1 hypothetical protein KDN34_02830 [Shewanella yunxiaonensis]
MSGKRLEHEIGGVESVSQSHQKERWSTKLYRWIMFLAFLLMGLGNWVDTKSLLTEGYDVFVANFTNWTEERTIGGIDVGNYLQYTEQKIGMPQVVKTSSIDSIYEYRYYKKPKFLLTLIVKGERIEALIVHALPFNNHFINGFNPKVPFSSFSLNYDSILVISNNSNEYFYDDQNLMYFMMDNQLGSNYMNLHLLSGFSEYGRAQIEEQKKLVELDSAEMLDDTSKAVPLVKSLAQTPATFYAISELDGKYVADALLTRFEFNAYF